MNEYSRKSLKTLVLLILTGIIILGTVITLSDARPVSIWNVIDGLASVLAIVLGLHYYVPKK